MSNVVPIARERIEIGQVVGPAGALWMMFVIEADGAEGETYAETYATRDLAVAAAETWELPIRFVNEPGALTEVTQ